MDVQFEAGHERAFPPASAYESRPETDFPLILKDPSESNPLQWASVRVSIVEVGRVEEGEGGEEGLLLTRALLLLLLL